MSDWRDKLRERDNGKESDEDREQAIRDYWGYSPSEKRTKAERDEVAARIMAKAQPSEVVDELRERMRREEAIRLRLRSRSTDFGNKMG